MRRSSCETLLSATQCSNATMDTVNATKEVAVLVNAVATERISLMQFDMVNTYI